MESDGREGARERNGRIATRTSGGVADAEVRQETVCEDQSRVRRFTGRLKVVYDSCTELSNKVGRGELRDCRRGYSGTCMESIECMRKQCEGEGDQRQVEKR